MADPRPTHSDDRAKEIFLEAMARPPAERAACVRKACGEDEALLERTEALLRAGEKAEQLAFLGEATIEPDSPTDPAVLIGVEAAEAEESPTHLGPYRLGELLGEGGFGKVYLAHQEHPVVRTVAVKLLKPGMDSRQVIARFEAERQALALMNHPGIARILDAGATESGRPFFVMEHVDGEPVTEYCDRRSLETRDRLELFEKICRAVQHAHQKGIIHRDLKPTNVLVTEHDDEPLPKVIDFGIAKAIDQPLTDLTLDTGVLQLLGTPLYMSPEQARVGEKDIDTRSDIYSLGALLYEVLTGTPPFVTEHLARSGLAEMQRIISQEVPQRPSHRARTLSEEGDQRAEQRRTDANGLSRTLSGDLDWIVLKTLEKDRTRRYESAAGLANDIRRHLDDEPVMARHPGAFYLFCKFVRRHQIAATAYVAIGTALLIGFIMAMVGLQQASDERDVSEAARGAAEQRLRDSYVAQARAARAGNRPGRRFDSLEALRLAARIERTPDLRDEAIACLALTDVHLDHTWAERAGANGDGLRTADQIAYQTEPGRLRVESLINDETVAELTHGEKNAWFWVFSPAGEYLAVSYEDQSLVVWNLTDSTPALELPPGRFSREAIAFDRAEGPPRWLALSESDDQVHLYRLPDGSPWLTLPSPDGRVIAVSDPDGRRLAVAGNGEPPSLVIYTLDGSVTPIEIPPESEIYAIDWNTQDTMLAAGASDTNIYLHAVDDGRLLRVLAGHQAPVVRVDFDLRGDVLASYAWDNSVRLWNTGVGEPLIGPLRGFWLSGLGDHLLTVRQGVLGQWRVERGGELRRGRTDSVFGAPARVTVTADGSWLATAGANGLRLWEVATLTEVATLSDEHIRSAHFVEGDSALLAATEDELMRWPIVRDGGRMKAGTPVLLGRFNNLRATAIGSEGRTLVAVDSDGAHVFDLDELRVTAHMPYFRGMATEPSLSPDGRWLFTGSWKGDPAAVWDRRTGTMVARFPGGHVVGQFSPDGRWLCLSDGSEHRFHEVGTWELVRVHPRDNVDDLAGAIAFAPDGSMVAIAHSRYVTELIEPETGRVLASLENPDDLVMSYLTFDGTGSILTAMTSHRSILVWDLGLIRRRLQEMGLDWTDAER